MFKWSGRILVVLAATAAIVCPATAPAAQLIGQTGPPVDCGENASFMQATVAAGQGYSPSAYGVITSWSAMARATPNETLKLMVLKPAGGTQFIAVRKDVTRTLTTLNALNTFAVRLPIEANETLGLFVPLQASPFGPCAFSTLNAGDNLGRTGVIGEPPDNTSVDYSTLTSPYRVNASAAVEPDADRDVFGDETQDKCVGTPGQFNGCPNTVTLDTLKQKGKKPKVVATVTVPGQGTLKAGSPGDPALAAAAANVSLKPFTQTFTATTASRVTLTLPLTKSAKRKLSKKGKLKVQVTFSFTPTGGTAGSLTAKTKLKR
jgi:hypothetical protein